MGKNQIEMINKRMRDKDVETTNKNLPLKNLLKSLTEGKGREDSKT